MYFFLYSTGNNIFQFYARIPERWGIDYANRLLTDEFLRAGHELS